MELRYRTDTVELRKAMAEGGYTSITKLSDDSGVNRNTIGKIVKGEAQPSTDVMYRLAATLNMTPERAGATFFASNLRNT